MYKINLHAHSIYSDGNNIIDEIVAEYKKHDFSIAVITDHCYRKSSVFYDSHLKSISISPDTYLRASEDALRASNRYSIPVVIGVEFDLGYNEMVVIGSDAIKYLLDQREAGIDICAKTMEYAKHKYNLSYILVHPNTEIRKNDKYFIEKRLTYPMLHAYELYNRACKFFDDENPLPDYLEGKLALCNSDAHSLANISKYYNLFDSEPKNEYELINLINSCKGVKHVLK